MDLVPCAVENLASAQEPVQISRSAAERIKHYRLAMVMVFRPQDAAQVTEHKAYLTAKDFGGV